MVHKSFRLLAVLSFALIHGACSGGDDATSTAGKQTLSVSVQGAGSIQSAPAGLNDCSASAPCSAAFKSGSAVVLTAVAAAGSTFAGWSGACAGSSATCVVQMGEARNAVAQFQSLPACSAEGATRLATIRTDGAGKMALNQAPNRLCPKAHWGQVSGICHGEYAVQVNAYGTPPANTDFSMWSHGPSCWGIHVSEPANPKFVYWNAPIVTRGFSFGYSAPLTASGGLQVAALNQRNAEPDAACPKQGRAGSLCVKWAMEVPGLLPQSVVNSAAATLTSWDAMIDVYFHAVPTPGPNASVSFDLQIYQMLMDWQATNGPNWATNMLRRYTTKTIGGVTYLVTVNTQSPGTEGSGWVGHGGQLNAVSLFALPTHPTTKAANGSPSYLWGTPAAVHDVGGIVKWLSQTETRNGQPGIFDDAGKPLYDNVRKANVSAPLLNPEFFLTGINAGFEVIQANATDAAHANNAEFHTTDYWVALPGEAIGK